MITPTAPLQGCLHLCLAMIQQLSVAKHNRKECLSLKTVILCIQDFLENLRDQGLSPAGLRTIERIRDSLNSSQAFLSKVATTGPLVSLLLATDVRQDIMRFSSDLRTCFDMLGAGEKLVYMNVKRMKALSSVQGELKSSRTLFTDQEMVAMQLRDTAAAAQQKGMHPEQLHALLLHQLEQVEEVSCLNPDELLAELHALQLEALYGEDLSHSTKTKPFGDKTEEFLLQQVCAACTPKAAKSNRPLAPPAAVEAPAGYLCPISKELMVQPVILTQTGHTYETANIKRWLELHNTCPATGLQLPSKQLVPNHALKKSIEEWAQDHGVRLPCATVHAGVPMVAGAVGPSASAPPSTGNSYSIIDAAQQAVSASETASQRTDIALQAGDKDRCTAAKETASWAADATADGDQNRGSGSSNTNSKDVELGIRAQQDAPQKSRCRCTLTRWALVLIALVVVVGVVSTAVGVHFGHKAKAAPNPSPTPSPPGSPSPARLELSQIQTVTPFLPVRASPSVAPPRAATPPGMPSPSPPPSNEANVTFDKLLEPGVQYSTGLAWDAISTGFANTCGILSGSRQLRCWGSPLSTTTIPADVANASWASVDVRAGLVCGILNTTYHLRCWGDYPQVTASLARLWWKAVSSYQQSGPSAGIGWQANRYAQTCGIWLGNGAMWCWDPVATAGQDPGHAPQNNVPANAAQRQWSSVSVGDDLVCGLYGDNTNLQCWHWNGTDAPVFPGLMNESWAVVDVTRIACGILAHSGALRCSWQYVNPDDLFGWGMPTDIVAWTAVSTGVAHTCGLEKGSGRLACWGPYTPTVPSELRNASWEAISVGESFTCGILSRSREIVCFGISVSGEIDVPNA